MDKGKKKALKIVKENGKGLEHEKRAADTSMLTFGSIKTEKYAH